MNCKEFEKIIPDYIDQKLDYTVLRQFSQHMNSCESCHEELTIQFLVTEGMQRLEEGDSFDLQNELEKRLSIAKKQMKWHRCILAFGLFLEFVAVLCIVGAVVWLFL